MQRESLKPLRESLSAGAQSLMAAQDPSGCWKGRYNGPLFLIPGYVAAFMATGEEIEADTRAGILRYLRHHQGEDGGWGLHIEDESRVYPTVTCYVAARLCGLEANSPEAQRARNWMEQHGDARRMAPWGKYLLALLGLYAYRGVLPLPPELWLLPRWFPLHPARLWNHARMVYLPLCYLYGRRLQAESTPLLDAIREEIFTESSEAVDWEGARFLAGERDCYVPLGKAYQWVSRLLLAYERHPIVSLRNRALDFVYDQIRQEDENTNYICVGPVSKIYNLIARHDREPDSEAARAHWRELEIYVCREPEGLSLHGYNHSRLWDTAFGLQALEAASEIGDRGEIQSAWIRGRGYVLSQQVWEETPNRERYFRDRSRGGWPFSDVLHGWPISDCTAEGVKVCLAPGFERAPEFKEERLEQAVSRILEWQNPDGGWPTYERRRAPVWLEALNPSMVFAEIMVDHSHVECTSACLQALDRALPEVSSQRQVTLRRAIGRGRRFLQGKQRVDGGWLGGWGVCFTYGAWFATWGLNVAPDGSERRHLTRAVEFLLRHQREDGGWAETVENCRTGEYLSVTGPSHPVKTAWAVLAITRCGAGNEGPLQRGLEFLRSSQKPDGDWPEEPLNGVFNRTCAIRYDSYRRIFPVWALAEGIKSLEK